MGRCRGFALVAALGLLALVLPGIEPSPVTAHNLQTKMVYMFVDPATQGLLDTRINGGWTPGDPLLQVNDEVGLIIKVVPRDGTTTGVGGHVDFYVPNGVTVLDAAYVIPNGSGGYDEVAMKGQSPIPTGAGPNGAKVKTELIGLTLGPNINGVTEKAVADGTGLMRGTIAGVYGDTGIFYSTAPDTNFDSWVESGGFDQNTGTSDNTVTNNSGDVVTPLNKWDAEQLLAWGSTSPAVAIVDTPDQRGNAPWGLASGVAGPSNGYAWDFDWDFWRTSPKTAADMRAASDQVGPWKRIRYPGSRLSKDIAGSPSTTNGFASIDGSTVGVNLKTGDLPPTHPTTGQTDSTSPKAVRWAVGQLTQYKPEYVWVKVKVDDTAAILDPSGCPIFDSGTFGGDAGGASNGKDHLWRYYEPSRARWNGCAGIGKPADRIAVQVGDTFQYKVKFYNLGTLTLTNVIVRDTLPAGVTFISAVPAQSSGPNPLQWVIGTLQPGQKFEAVVTVKATGSGLLENCIVVDTSELPDKTACESTYSGPLPFLRQTKSVSPTTVAPGGTVQYTLQVDNIGSGPTGSPVTIDEYLPAGFTFVSKDLVTINGANVTASTTVNTASPYSVNQPRFSVPGGINAGQSLILKFTVQVAAGTPAGNYCNTFTTTESGVPAITGSLACVDVGGGAIGDRLWRDWDGDGAQDADEEGLAGVVLELQDGVCTPGVSCPSTITDAAGVYQFTGLSAGTYTVKVLSGVPAGYTLTGDPDELGACLTCDGQSTVTIATGEKKLDRDFGYRPGGTGSVGDRVFDDKNASAVFDGTDAGIANVTVRLYEDTNGNGTIDIGTDALVATTATNGSGTYAFSGLATGLKYIADVDQADADIASYFVATYGTSAGVTQTTTDPHNVGTLSGAYTSADFGFYKTVPGSIGDDVFVDTDNDGVRDAGEVGLPNITVKLYLDSNANGVWDLGEPLVQTVITDADGKYLFTGLPAGNYIVDLDQADTDIPGFLRPARDPIATSLTASQQRLDVDFPLVGVLSKSVDKAFVNTAGTVAERTVTYQITPRWPVNGSLAALSIQDAIPAGTTYIAASVEPGDDANNFVDDVADPPTRVEWDLGSTVVAVPGVFSASGTSTTDFFPVADTYGREDQATTNFGASTTLEAKGRGTDKRRSFLQFDLSTLPADATIVSGVLSLVRNGGSNKNKNYSAHRVTAAWTEAGLTWTNQPAHNAAAESSIVVGGNGTYAWNITSLAQGWKTGAIPNNGVAIRGANELRDDRLKQFASRETSGTSNDPVLRVQHTALTGAFTRVSLDARPALVSGTTAQLATIVMTVEVAQNTGAGTVTPPTNLTVTSTGSPTVAKVSGPVPVSAAVPAGGGTVTFTYTYNITPNPASLGEVKFGGAPTTGAAGFPTFPSNAQFTAGTSDTVLHTPPLEFKVLVSSSPGVSIVTNSADLSESSVIGNLTSNVVETAVSSTIGDRVWIDADADGVQDPGEGNMVGVRVYLDTDNDGVFDVGEPFDITDGNGAYRIGGLANGTYSVRLDTTTMPAGYYPTTSTVLSRVITTSGQQVNDADFGLASALGQVGDLVWLDADEDGAFDLGETPLSGVVVSLYNDVDNSGTVNAGDILLGTRTTDAGGQYLFDNLYTAYSGGNVNLLVDVVSGLPAGAVLVAGATDPRDVTLSNIAPIVLTADFPYNFNGQIGDFAWYDKDGDQVQDGPPEPACVDTGTNECGAPATTIVLYQDTDNNNQIDPGEPIVAVTVTDSDGAYLFDNLPPGNYVVKADTQQVPAPATSANAGQVGLMNSTTGSSKAVDLTVGNMTNFTADFGFIEAAKVEGHVFHDINHNGVLDGGEALLPNVTVTLTGTDTGGNPVSLSTTTSAGGAYKFLVPAGTYTIAYNTADPDIPANLTEPTTAVEFRSLTVIAGAEYQNLDFGRDDPGKIGDRVWKDDDADGVQDGGEIGLGGITVRLYADNNNDGLVDGGDTLLASQSTAVGTGAYLFEGLPVGGSAHYVVQVVSSTIPAGYSQKGDPDQAGVCTTCDHQGNADLPTATPLLTLDFGYQPTALSVSGNLWKDNDGDGVDDGAGEPGIPGVTMIVAIDSDGNGVTDLTLTAVTDASGNYTVTGIPTGSNVTITVDETTLPSDAYHQTGDEDEAGTCAVCDAKTTITNLTVNQTGKDFGYQQVLGSISGTVVEDADGDGLAEGGETAVAGVQVKLTAAGPDHIVGTPDDIVTTTTTDASGNYSFPDQAPGVYQITKVNPPGRDSLADRDGANPDNIGVTLTLGEAEVDQDFELQVEGAIGSRVWLDENADGIQDPGEPGLANVVIELWNATHTVLVATTVTDAYGEYRFSDLPSGTYQIDVDTSTLPSGLSQTPLANAGGDYGNQDFSDNDGGGPDMEGYPVVLVSGSENLTADFGFNWGSANTPPAGAKGAIGDRVWVDADGDGAQDPGEPGLGGVTVTIFHDPDQNGIYDTPYTLANDQNGATGTGTTVTEPDGSYVFYDLPAGGYVIVVTAPAGYTQTGDPDHFGAIGTNDDRTTTPVAIAPGDAFVNADFGYQPTVDGGPLDGSIGDTVWFDADADGTVDPGENGIPGVTVLLARDLDDDGIVDPGEIIATTTTDGAGQYLFDGLPAGDYLVRVDDAAGVLQGKTPSYDSDGIGTPNLADVTLGAGAAVTTVDFGYTAPGQTPATALIGDRIWVDVDGDGVQDAGEPGLEGATVGLYDSTGTVLLASAVTDENGHYAFGGLAAGTYVVKVTQPTGMTQTFDADGLGSAHQSTLTVAAGEVKLDQDFGYRGTGAISGEIWKDTSADGTRQAGETTGIPGVTVAVYWDLDGDGLVDPNEPIVGQAVTDGGGNYSVGGLPTDDGGGNAKFLVVVTDDANTLEGTWHTLGGSPGAEDNSQPTVYSVTLTPGSPTNGTADFGYSVDPGAVGNFVWSDLDGDGIQDPGEPGLGGVKVMLAIGYPNGDGATLVTISAADGAYSFGNLLLDEDFDGTGGGEPAFTLTFATPGGYGEAPTGAGTPFTDSDWDGATPIPVQPLEGVTDMALGNLTDAAAAHDAGFVPLSDSGDLPDSYGTTLAADGPRHEPGTRYLGALAGDVDTDGQPGSMATGDGDDEDGVVRDAATQWLPNQTVSIDVEVGGDTGSLGLWLDLDGNGAFEVDEFFAFPDLTEGSHSLQVTLTGDYVAGQEVYARARLFDPAALPGGTLDAGDSLGAAQDGEVEDYRWLFAPTAVTLIDLSARPGGTSTTGLLALAALALLGSVAVAGRRQGDGGLRPAEGKG